MENEEQTPGSGATPAASNRASCLPWALLALVVVPLLALAIGATVTLGGVAAAWTALNHALSGRLVVTDRQPAVVEQVRSLNRLETASFTIEKVVEGNDSHGNPILDALLGDRLLFIAHGEVIAGVDLAQLHDGDIQLSQDGQTATVRLPAAQIFTHSLDNNLSRVYDRSTGLLTRGDPALETKVRQQADSQVLQAACQDGILAQANTNAEAQVRSLLSGLRVTQVQFVPPTPLADTGCQPGY